MEPFIQLVCSEDRRFNAHLKLSRHRAELSGDNVVDIVYQWIMYDEYEIFGVVEGSIARFDLLINDTHIWIDRERSYVSNDRISITPSSQDLRPFANIFGFTSICLHLTMRNNEQIFWHTGMLAVAVEEGKKEYSASLQQMLWEIYRKDRTMLLCRPRRSSALDDTQSHTSLMHTCIERLYRMLPLFLTNPYRRKESCQTSAAMQRWGQNGALLPAYTAYSSGGLASVGAMARAVGNGGAFHSRRDYGSSRSLGDNYENRTIIAFINLLYQTVMERLNELRVQNTREELTITYRGELQPGYVLSNNILGQFLVTVIRERLREAEELQNSLSFLRSYYTRILTDSREVLMGPPQQAPAFVELPHYANIFELMLMWFVAQERGEGSGGSAIRFASADVIYEFYCLNTIQEIIEDAGFIEDKERRVAFDYPYRPPKFNTYHGDNTFFFTNEATGCKVTLYYQPLIYVDVDEEFRNGINLVRVDDDRPRCFYSPDFLLKRTDNAGTVYGIIDAKWRTRDTILKTALADAVNKYLHCIVERNTWKPVPFMWLLQGKDDEENLEASRRFASHLCYGENAPVWLRNSLGVVTLTPASRREELASILETFLRPGSFIS